MVCHLPIFRLACTDDGMTGCSLSLVSKRFGTISNPVEYQSAAVHGIKSLCALLKVLQRQAPINRQVRYLLITKCPRRKRMEDTSATKEDIEVLLNLVAPTLETLAIDNEEAASHWPESLPYPALRDLMLPMHSIHRVFRAGSPAFPALRRLHLFAEAARISHCLRGIIAFTPRLQALRSSGPQQDLHLPERVASIIGLTLCPARNDPPELLKPHLKSLKEVIVETMQSISTGQCGTGSRSHGVMVAGLLRLDSMTRDSGPRVMFVPQQHGYARSHLVADWMDVVGAGDGCWAVALEDGVKVAAARRLVDGSRRG